MKRSIAAAGIASLALFLGACSSGTSTTSTTTPTPMATTSTMESTPTPSTQASPTGDIVDTAVAAGDFKTLTAALTAAGLVDTLKGPGPFTVFAPNDAAFAKLPAGTVDTLLKEPQGKLSEILKYHVIKGEVKAADVLTMDGKKVPTLQGGDLTIKVNGDKVSLVDATGHSVNVITTDVQATNGVIHVIDGVLMPTA
ncbi:Uncaracterized surface protein containing fasciclin (FAS1) repeats [Raineyella antarctica]|uniref:Uncaracterized surface protein containing fasciclin (FAS1) repeats n=1 Tax=Raineyella antarctica TaxID=1577474 RepID=A0A1G6GFY2_9ACTN|nr:fasciclin domain-containing protein [Raineyella antarctica]SDB80799.1 Uncaracterized surface protein containing fasciclin (FAS1) repeats [Raineyella antarctica]